jgi:hypothetical protein
MSDVRQFVHRPGGTLRRHVREILWLNSEHSRVQVLLPETTLTLVLRQSGAASLHNENLPNTIVSGLQRRTRMVEHAPGSSLIIIRFTEVGAPAILHDRVDLLYNRTVPLDDLLPRQKIDRIQSILADTREIRQQILAVERFLTGQIRAENAISLQIEAAAEMIRNSQGRASIYSDCAPYRHEPKRAGETLPCRSGRDAQEAQSSGPFTACLPAVGCRTVPYGDRLRSRLLRSTAHGARLPPLHRHLPGGVFSERPPS